MMDLTDHSSFQLEQAKRFILEENDFLVVSHVQPDGDAASSTIAIGLILQTLNKSFIMLNEDKIPIKFDYLSGYELIQQAGIIDSIPRQYQNIIAVDCADFSRVGIVESWFENNPTILNIDHHPTNDQYGTIPLIQAEAAATAEILFYLVEALGVTWTKQLADCIYTGLLTDTGGFRYSNTSPKVMEIASKMLEFGVDGHQLAEHLLERIAFSHILILKRALSSLSFTENNRIGWMLVTQEDIAVSQANNEDLEGLVNYPRNIEGVEVGLLFKEITESTVKVSFRSAGKIDVASIAHRLGGGGHKRASGCTLDMTMNEAVPFIVNEIKQEMA
ncbi:MAG: bifunctional oligoribonuclease/PAP phosphatase NrnA [Paenibacillaceae bacterium]